MGSDCGRASSASTAGKQRERTASMLKETETIYARMAPAENGSRLPINAMSGRTCASNSDLIQSHECHGGDAGHGTRSEAHEAGTYYRHRPR